MKKIVPIGLFVLLLYHTLAYVMLVAGNWWLAENDLSERLLVYNSVDSIVEFEIPLGNKQELNDIAQSTSDGFTYNGHYYSVISMEVQGNLLHIASLEREGNSFWQNDLLAFLNEHLTDTDKTSRKSGQFLKLLVKEYSLTQQSVFSFLIAFLFDSRRIIDVPFVLTARVLPIHSPPPEC